MNLFNSFEFEILEKEINNLPSHSTKRKELTEEHLKEIILDIYNKKFQSPPTHIDFLFFTSFDFLDFKKTFTESFLDYQIKIGTIPNGVFKDFERDYLNWLFDEVMLDKSLLLLNAIDKLLKFKNPDFLTLYEKQELNKSMKKKYISKELLPFDIYFNLNKKFYLALSNSLFLRWASDICLSGFICYSKLFAPFEFKFKYGLGYTRKDVLKILNEDTNKAGTTLTSYFIFEKSKCFPNFIDYKKTDDLKIEFNYNDAFIDRKTLHWETSNETYEHKGYFPEVIKPFLQEGRKMDLFVSKWKKDKNYLYLGKATIDFSSVKTIQYFDSVGKKQNKLSMKLILEVPLSDEMWNFFHS